MKWRYYRTGLYTEKKRSHWLKQWPIRKGLGDKKGELSLVVDVIWTSSKRWTGQPMESSRDLGNLQRVNKFFLFAEKRIKTSQRLEERIKQHIPKSITNPPTPHIRQSLPRPGKATSPGQFHESAIGQHLLDNAECALHYNKDKFSVLARARTSFLLSALEATFIKSLNPLLCKQKEFVYSLKIS